MDFKQKVAEIFASIDNEMTVDEAVQIVEIPPNPDMGDYAVPCFKFAKKYRKAPAAIATELVEKIGKIEEFEKIESAGPYVNFFVDKTHFAEKILKQAYKEKENFGSTNVGQGKTVIVEFSSPNIAKPFHIGHIRSTLIGNSIYKIYSYMGYNTVAINHLGDYGTQFGMLISAYKKWGSPEIVEAIEKDPIPELLKLYVRYNQEIETHPEYKDEARYWFKELENGNEEAQKLFWSQLYEKLYPLGIDVWWMDASEPNVRDCTDMDYRKALCGPTALGPSTEYFNAYAPMNAKAIYEGLRSVDKNKRIFQLTRSGFAGLQRYSTATWSGDIATRWEDMKAQIPAGINFSMSGIPYWTMDNGGFCVEKRYEKAPEGSADREEWRELNVRWHQFGALVPIFRTHGQFPFREIWNIAPETHPAYKTMLYYTQLRYKLMPYIYTLAARSYFDDYSMMRGLIMDFPQDKNVHSIGDQYMFGNALMVCPVYKFKARSREVYFPAETTWFDFYTGKMIKGGQKLTVEAPYNRMPLYVPAGSIVPMGEVVQHTHVKQDELTIFVYGGNYGSFNLYEDEGLNYNYQNGKHSEIAFRYSEADQILYIAQRKGDFEGMTPKRTFKIVFVNDKSAFGNDSFPQKVQTIHYDGNKTSVRL